MTGSGVRTFSDRTEKILRGRGNGEESPVFQMESEK